jgi:hypothetical protein
MSASRRVTTIVREEDATLVEQILEKVTLLGESHALMEERLGKIGPDGKSGTGLIGDMAELKTEVKSLVGLKNMGRGLLIGIVVAVSIAVAGVEGGFRLLGGSALLLGQH